MPDKPKTVQVALRLDAKLIDEADELAESYARVSPGIEPTRTAILRAAVVRGLALIRSEVVRRRR
jgi:hypothetical protein